MNEIKKTPAGVFFYAFSRMLLARRIYCFPIIVFKTKSAVSTWRNTEPARRTEREHYPPEFRMIQQDIDNAPEVPTIPPLLTK